LAGRGRAVNRPNGSAFNLTRSGNIDTSITHGLVLLATDIRADICNLEEVWNNRDDVFEVLRSHLMEGNFTGNRRKDTGPGGEKTTMKTTAGAAWINDRRHRPQQFNGSRYKHY